MSRRNYPIYALVAVAAALGAIWAGVPASTVLLLGLVLACPLMMVFMHGGGGHGGGHGRPVERDTGHRHGAADDGQDAGNHDHAVRR